MSEELKLFCDLLDQYRFDFCKLVYIIFPFGQKGHPLEHEAPYDWQLEEWQRLSAHLKNPATRFLTYRLNISSGNGAAKTSFGAMTTIMLMMTQRVRGRITANTDVQMRTIIWPEYDIWFNHARFADTFFEKFGTSIKARDEKLSESWRFDTVTWSAEAPQAMSGLHNKGGCCLYVFEEAPGIPSVIWKYAQGAFTETETIKIWMAFGNSDDPESQFEQNMTSPLWHARRIDTRTLKHIAKDQIDAWLLEAGGDEDNDDFRVRVRGLPRKTAKDSIMRLEDVESAFKRRKGFDKLSVSDLPVILRVDPAWTGGDETTIWYSQGHYHCLLERFKLEKGQTHQFTYNKLVSYERTLRADAVFIDQGEGTAIYTLALNAGKAWELVSFASSPNDTADFQTSQYANMRAKMYYEASSALKHIVLDCVKKEDEAVIKKQLCWTKGGRHKVHNKKLAEPKLEIKKRVGQSPDVADGFVLGFYREVFERLPENAPGVDGLPPDHLLVGQTAFKMPEHELPYESIDVEYQRLYGD